MKPTREQVESWRNEWHALKDAQSTPITYIAQRAAEWAAAQSAERISALEAANAKQAARIAELEDEREKLEKQEPSCWTTPDGKGFRMRFSPPVNDVALGWTPLYARPVPARTLTDEEIWEIYKSKYACQHFPVVFARAIEAWLKGGE